MCNLFTILLSAGVLASAIWCNRDPVPCTLGDGVNCQMGCNETEIEGLTYREKCWMTSANNRIAFERRRVVVL